MTEEPGWLQAETDGDRLSLHAGGVWTIDEAARLDALVRDVRAAGARRARLDLSRVTRLDTSGAWLFDRVVRRLAAEGIRIDIAGAAPDHAPLLRLVENDWPGPAKDETPSSNAFLGLPERVGRGVVAAGEQAKQLLNFFGATLLTLFSALREPRRLRLVALVNQMEQTGLNAVPIVGLLSFLIGVVLAYQGASQLRRFGAEIFTVDLLAISVLREIGVLLAAILIAGRSGSAFTAQIGTMQVNEEVDALRTIGIDPIEVLVLPRMNALLLTLPLLTFIADVMGLLGGAIMSVVVLDFTFAQFLQQLRGAAGLDHFLVGMVKAPVFAYIIAIVGCFEGLRVSGSAESVGRMTTRSVVESIFLVIVADAIFSILFAGWGFDTA